jgi:hypothetical protein
VFYLNRDVTTIGSDRACDICLPGLYSVHAEVRHDERDEFVVLPGDVRAVVAVNGAPAASGLLRTGTGIDVGPWHLSYMRDEYADHGRPYGGRIGGELGHQRAQPSRTGRGVHKEEQP